MNKPVSITDKLRAASYGHPIVSIAWPHRLFHEAANTISELEAENQRLRNALKEIADGEIYPQEVARAALYG